MGEAYLRDIAIELEKANKLKALELDIMVNVCPLDLDLKKTFFNELALIQGK